MIKERRSANPTLMFMPYILPSPQAHNLRFNMRHLSEEQMEHVIGNRERSRRWRFHCEPTLELILAGTSLAAVALFMFYGVGKSLWLDEAYSVYVSNHNFGGIIADLRNDTHPPLYYLLLAVWMRAFGDSELAIRSLSGLCYLASVAAVYRLGRELYDRRTGALCAFLFLLSPLATSQAQQARMYAPLCLLSALSTLLFVKIFLRGQRSGLTLSLYVIVNALGTFTQIWFFFLLFAQFAVCALLFSRKEAFLSFKLIALSCAPYAALWSPLLWVQLHINATSWLPRPGITEFVKSLLGFYGERVALFVYAVIAALLLLHLIRNYENARADSRRFLTDKRTLTLILSVAFTLGAPFLISQVKPIFGPTRYTIIALPSLAALLGAALGRLTNRITLIIGCFVLLTGVTSAFVKYKNRSETCSDKVMTAYLAENASDNDIIVYTSLSRTATDYYLRRMRPETDFIKFTFPSETDSHPGWRNTAQLLNERDALNHEAEELTARIAALMKQRHGRLWLFYGLDREVSDVLKTKLDQSLRLRDRIAPPCAGNPDVEMFYTEILIYE